MNDQKALEIRDALARLGISPPVPVHVIGRLAFFVERDRAIRHVDARIDISGSDCVGKAIIFTDDTVVFADWRESQNRSDFSKGSSASVTAWARSSLSAVDIGSHRGDSINTDADWQEDYGSYWPKSALLTLHYDQVGKKVELPFSVNAHGSQREKFRTFAQSLLVDVV